MVLRYPFYILIFIFIFSESGIQAAEKVAEFDGRRAYELLKRQCAFGPRVPGSEAASRCADFIEAKFRELGIPVRRQIFNARSTLLGGTVRLVNIIADYRGDVGTSDILALSAHWDTRPISEKDPDPAMRNRPIPAANDGASGVALLIEIARVLKKRHYPGRVLFLFFDGEDLGTTRFPEEFCLGSKYFARHSLKEYPITAGINFDMIGDRDLKIQPEQLSLRFAPAMSGAFWKLAEKHAPFQFSTEPYPYAITDDHEPFLKRGVPYIDVIDFDYPFWHTQGDTPDKCSPISLQIVGNIAVRYIFSRRTKVLQVLPEKDLTQ